MGIRWYEWKKLMCHSGGFLIIGIFVLLEILGVIFSHASKVSEMGRYRASYEQYLFHAAGKVDGETEEFFAEKNEEFSQAESLLQTIYQRYSAGELTEQEYRDQLAALEKLMAGRKGYDILYGQYLYARENPENRYLLDTNAWDALLSEDTLNMALLLAILLLTLLCFGRENMSEMDAVIRISADGERKTAGEKIRIVILLSLGLCVLDFGIRAAFFQRWYGFSHGGYPVQSMEFYSEYEGSISLREAALRIFLFRMAGCALWGMTAGAAMAGIRKYAVSMLASLALMLLPYYGLPQGYMKYFLPGPLGFFIGTGYCQGTAFEYNEVTGREAYRFIQVPGHTKLFLGAANLFLGVLCIGFILQAYTNHWTKKSRGGRNETILFMVFCMVCFSGCGGRRDSTKAAEILYNLDNRYYYESENYLVYVDYEEGGACIVVREKESGNTFPLIRDVFRENKEILSGFYGEGNRIYYMERSFDNKDRYFSKLYDTVSIVCVDLDSFESRIIFRDNANTDRDSVLGQVGRDASFYSDVAAFVVRGSRIYFISSGEVSEVNALSGGRKTLFSYNGGNAAYDGSSFFFLDSMSRLRRYSLEENREEAVGDIAAGKFLLEKDGILYTDREHGAALTAIRFHAEFSREILVEEEPLVFYSDGKNIFFVPKREAVIYELEAGKGSPKEIGKNTSAVIYPFSSYGAVFVPDMEAGGVEEYLK